MNKLLKAKLYPQDLTGVHESKIIAKYLCFSHRNGLFNSQVNYMINLSLVFILR